MRSLARVSGRLRHHAADAGGFSGGRRLGGGRAGPHDGDARIHAILPRTSRFSRRAAGDATEEQIVAANIDTVFLVAGLDRDFNPRRIERYLVVARESGASPVIVLNKADLVDDPGARVEEVRSARERRAGARGVLQRAGDARCPRAVSRLRPDRCAARIVRRRQVDHREPARRSRLLRTQDVRESDSRGRHTSANRQLVMLPGTGVLIDTPGMRELQLWETGEALADAFADIEALAPGCRFRDCQHRSEPGCAVVDAVASRRAACRSILAKLRRAGIGRRRRLLDQKRRSRIERADSIEGEAATAGSGANVVAAERL